MKKPTIRFKAFDGEWVERKMLDIAPLQRGFDLPNSQLKKGSVPVVCSNGIVAYHNEAKCKAPGLVTGRSGTIGKFTLILDGSYWPHNTSLWVTDFKKNLPIFISYLYQTIEIEKYATGSGVPTLNRNDVHEHKCLITDDNAEQTAIGSFFTELDSLIEGKRVKLNKLKKLKLAYLGKMFPKKGSRVPEVRFMGFSGDWVEKPLGKIGSPYTGLSGKGKADFGHGNAKYITYMNVFSNPVATIEQTDKIEVDRKQNCVKKNDVFFTVSSETPEEVGMSSVWTYDKENVYLNSFCFGFRPCENIDPYYFAYLMRSPIERNQIILLAQGISRFNISKTKMMDISVLLPSLPEQQKIGSFFRNLDNLIGLQQQELDKLANIKSACLSKMFAKSVG